MRHEALAWLGLCALLALGATAAWWIDPSALDWQPALAADEPWRWWTAAFVHWSPSHLGGNLAGLALIALLGRRAGVPGVMAVAWLASWPLTHLGLLMRPDLLHYGGLSGVLHGAVTVVSVWLLRSPTARERWVGGVVLVGLTAKVLLEQPWVTPVQPVLAWNIAVAPLAHATGAGSALVCAVLALARGPAPGR